ncbi:MAG: hypothetical protein PVG39_10440 [Desulfobacteraceae bacterium]|jgi:hypothetical protein
MPEHNPERKSGRINPGSRLVNQNPVSLEIRTLLSNRSQFIEE